MDKVKMTRITLMLPEETANNIRLLAGFRGIAIDKAVTQAIDFLVDTIVDNFAQNLHDHFGYSGGKGNHNFTLSEVLDPDLGELQQYIDTRKAEKQQAMVDEQSVTPPNSSEATRTTNTKTFTASELVEIKYKSIPTAPEPGAVPDTSVKSTSAIMISSVWPRFIRIPNWLIERL